jgi:hypothetical protein
LQEHETGIIRSPFDLDGTARQLLALAQEATERHGFARRKAGFADKLFRDQLGGGHAVRASIAMFLTAGLDGAEEAALAQQDAIRDHLALGNRRAQAPRRRNQHLAFGGLAQSAAGSTRRHKRLDQYSHRGIGWRKTVVIHVTAGVRGP